MGRIYEAWHERLERAVALKALPPGSTEAGKRRFLREARSLSALNHPEIVTVHDLIAGETGDFIVMELVQGQALDALLEKGPLSLERALRTSRSIARALEAAHEKGVIHRDLKPANVMLTKSGSVKLVDFGLAKLVAPDGRTSHARTQAGDVLGTFGYMSPEQARGEEIDQRSDVFSFGALLYEMLAGQQPFPGSNPAVIAHRLITSEPAPLAHLRPDLPEELVALVEHCLRKEARDRPPSFAPILRALTALDPDSASGVEARHGPSSRRDSRQRAHRRRVWPAALGVPTLGVLLVAGWAGLTGHLGLSAPAPTDSVAQSPDALFREGSELLERHDRKGNLEAARERFRSAIALEPEYPAAFAGLATAELEIFINENRDPAWLRRAFQSASRAVELDSHLAVGHTALGRVLTQQGEISRAKEELAEARRLEPRSSAVHRALGQLAYAQQDLELAEQHFSTALELGPREWASYSGLVEVLFAAGRLSEARTALEGWIELTPDNVFAFQSLGAVQGTQGELAEAAAALQRALEIRPEANVYSNLGTLHFLQGHYEPAAAAFRRAVELKPNQRLFWFNLGDTLRQIEGAEEEGREAFSRATQLTRDALERNPDDTFLLGLLAECQAKQGELEGALGTLTLLERHSDLDRPGVWFSALKAYEIAGDRAGALRTLRRALELGHPRLEIETDPELLELRQDLRFHQIVAHFM